MIRCVSDSPTGSISSRAAPLALAAPRAYPKKVGCIFAPGGPCRFPGGSQPTSLQARRASRKSARTLSWHSSHGWSARCDIDAGAKMALRPIRIANRASFSVAQDYQHQGRRGSEQARPDLSTQVGRGGCSHATLTNLLIFQNASPVMASRRNPFFALSHRP